MPWNCVSSPWRQVAIEFAAQSCTDYHKKAVLFLVRIGAYTHYHGNEAINRHLPTTNIPSWPSSAIWYWRLTTSSRDRPIFNGNRTRRQALSLGPVKLVHEERTGTAGCGSRPSRRLATGWTLGVIMSQCRRKTITFRALRNQYDRGRDTEILPPSRASKQLCRCILLHTASAAASIGYTPVTK